MRIGTHRPRCGIEGPTRLRLRAAAALALAALSLRWVGAHGGVALFPAYRTVSKALVSALALVASVVPFALWDLAALVLVLAGMVALIRCQRAHQPLLPLLSHAVLLLATAAFLFVAWAFNHYAPPLATELGLSVRAYTTEELAAATGHYLKEAAQLAPQVPRDDDGSLARQDFYELARIAGSSYQGLAEAYPLFAGPTVPVKALLVWGEPLLYSGHTGIFFAPTGEAGVPLNSAIADEPYIMCHEAAHRLGLASEQEANFAAYLACAASDDVRLAYAGAYNAFAYCFNALWRYDQEAATALVEEAAAGDLHEGVALLWADRQATHEHYAAYDGPFEKVGTRVNDSYLKSFGQSAGVRSYGLVVDYLIAWYQQAS